MECPHCGEETDPTLIYCKVCGESMELDEETVNKAIERDTELEAIEDMEIQSRGTLYLSIFALASIIALRLVLLRPVPSDVSPGYYADSRILETKSLEPPAALPLDEAPIPIPDWKPEDKK